MCGLAGYLVRGPAEAGIAAAMAAVLAHRGPDGHGVWCDAESGVALAHRRLAIIDLSPAGAQPMVSACGRFVLALNGEIYDHAELRRGLDASTPAWRGHSDTESLLAAFARWGVEATLRRCTGMFALALWDRERRELVLARDRLGEKPLYYGWQGRSFVFGSEPKALAAHPDWRGDVDRDALALYMRVGYVPAPLTAWQGVRKLPPGTWAVLGPEASPGAMPAPVHYWRAAEVASVPPRTDLDDAAAADELERHLRRAVAGQMASDVPLGAFLSGGVDSSAVVALMQARSATPVRSFSIGFAEGDYDEAPHAAAIAALLGTEHTECRITPADALAVVPTLAEMYDEPFGDSSQIPTHLVAALARRDVTVSLSGDGGDELFGGYNRHFWGRRLWHRVAPVPRPLRSGAARLVAAIAPASWDRLGRRLPQRWRQPALGDRLHKLADVLDVAGPDEMYLRLVAQQRESAPVVLGGTRVSTWADGEGAAFDAGCRGHDFTERMMFRDLVAYLADDILVKVDRAAMAVGLETRVPLLDHRLVEFAWSLPLHMKVRNGQGKWLLRQVLYRHVPRELIERPKQGFALPLDGWLRGPLREWADSLLDESRLRQEGFLDPRVVRQRWAEHLSGRRNRQHWLWNVLMFQAWRERWL